MFKYNNLSDVFSGFNTNLSDIEKDIMTSVNTMVKQQETYNIPWNIILEEDGSNTIEVAVPGKSRDDIKVKGISKDGKSYLVIEVIEKELTDEEKEYEEKRKYSIHKMKSGKLYKELEIPSALDIKKTTVTVVNGLLTVKIPVAEEAKPIEFEIQ